MQELFVIVFCLAILGFGVWYIERFVPMSEPFRILIRFVVVVGLLYWAWQRFGGRF